MRGGGWRQLTSMRTALILLLLLALAAIPGSVIPQRDVDSLKTTQWQAAHPKLTPVYEKLGLFSVYDSPWFSAIYLLLMVSLVGCFVPAHRRLLEGDAGRAAAGPPQPVPPPGPHDVHDARSGATTSSPGARALLDQRGYRVVAGATARCPRSAATCARRATCCSTSRCWWCWWASRSAASSATGAA